MASAGKRWFPNYCYKITQKSRGGRIAGRHHPPIPGKSLFTLWDRVLPIHRRSAILRWTREYRGFGMIGDKTNVLGIRTLLQGISIQRADPTESWLLSLPASWPIMTILLADDHALFRQGIRYILLEHRIASGIFLEADSLASTLDALAEQSVDLVLLDLLMPGMNGKASLQAVVRAGSRAPVVVISAVQDARQVEISRQSGVAGFIPKNVGSDTLASALRLILEGGSYFPRLTPDTAADAPAVFTRRQREVLLLMADGLSNKAIARRLAIAETTVKNHVTAIFQLLGADNRVQAVNRARSMGNL